MANLIPHSKNLIDTLKLIASWKIDASNEDMNKYFFAFDEFSRIQDGEISIVLGRKGSGKTAACEYLHTKRAENKRSVRLSFKDFPFDQLYRPAESPRAKSSQYINLWKLIVLSATCWLMAHDPRVDYKTRRLLASHFSDDPAKALSTTLTKWTSGKIEIPDFGFGATGGSIERSHLQNEQSLGERVSRLEEFLIRAAPNTKYYLLFDDLHEDYGGEKDDSEYFMVLTGLISAITYLRSIFRKNGKSIIPIAFIRNDIYSRVRHSDKNHWLDVQCILYWDHAGLLKMIDHRISADAGAPYSLESWRSVLQDSSRVSRLDFKRTFRYVGLLDYMLELTQHRPRDILHFFRLAASRALVRGAGLIDTNDISDAETDYSSYLRQEFEDEIHLVVPNFMDFLTPFKRGRQPTITYPEFLNFIRQQPAKIIKEKSPEEIMTDLWECGIVGAGRAQIRFRYMSKFDLLSPFRDTDEAGRETTPIRIAAHPGLRSVLSS